MKKTVFGEGMSVLLKLAVVVTALTVPIACTSAPETDSSPETTTTERQDQQDAKKVAPGSYPPGLAATGVFVSDDNSISGSFEIHIRDEIERKVAEVVFLDFVAPYADADIGFMAAHQPLEIGTCTNSGDHGLSLGNHVSRTTLSVDDKLTDYTELAVTGRTGEDDLTVGCTERIVARAAIEWSI